MNKKKQLWQPCPLHIPLSTHINKCGRKLLDFDFKTAGQLLLLLIASTLPTLSLSLSHPLFPLVYRVQVKIVLMTHFVSIVVVS